MPWGRAWSATISFGPARHNGFGHDPLANLLRRQVRMRAMASNLGTSGRFGLSGSGGLMFALAE